MTDYASKGTKDDGMRMIKSELDKISNPVVKERATEYINKIES